MGWGGVFPVRRAPRGARMWGAVARADSQCCSYATARRAVGLEGGCRWRIHPRPCRAAGTGDRDNVGGGHASSIGRQELFYGCTVQCIHTRRYFTVYRQQNRSSEGRSRRRRRRRHRRRRCNQRRTKAWGLPSFHIPPLPPPLQPPDEPRRSAAAAVSRGQNRAERKRLHTSNGHWRRAALAAGVSRRGAARCGCRSLRWPASCHQHGHTSLHSRLGRNSTSATGLP